MSRLENLEGKKFGYLTVLEIAEKKFSRTHWKCLCECGKVKDIMAKHLKLGAVTSCGCMKNAKGSKSRTWRGHGEISAHYWCRIKRCASERNLIFSLTIEEAWALFLKQNRKCTLTGLDISILEEHTASLDRIDSKKGYEISNVQWVHKDINLMKMDFEIRDFFAYCKLITEYNKL